MNTQVDFIVIGAGIAGLSAAAELAESAKVVVLEAEDQPGFHSSGRSAAYFAPAYGNETVRGISAACEGFFRKPPQGFSDVALLRPREAIFIGRADQQAAIADMKSEVDQLIPLDAVGVGRHVPILDQGHVASGLLDPVGGDLVVDALLQGYARLFKRRGGQFDTATEVTGMTFRSGIWSLETPKGTYSAPIIINAAGAWADQVTALAGRDGIGIEPKRRTVVLIDAPTGHDITEWPLVIDVDE